MMRPELRRGTSLGMVLRPEFDRHRVVRLTGNQLSTLLIPTAIVVPAHDGVCGEIDEVPKRDVDPSGASSKDIRRSPRPRLSFDREEHLRGWVGSGQPSSGRKTKSKWVRLSSLVHAVVFDTVMVQVAREPKPRPCASTRLSERACAVREYARHGLSHDANDACRTTTD